MDKGSRLINYFHRIRIPLYIFAGLIFMSVLIIFIVTTTNRNNEENSTRTVEEAETLLNKWLDEKSTESNQVEDIRKIAKEVINEHPYQQASARAYFVLARIERNLGNYATASEYYQKLVRHFPRSYLAAISLYNAATAEEEREKDDNAINLYKKLIQNYTSLEAARAMFSLGRLYEKQKNYQEAAIYYQKLYNDESKISNTTWKNLAKSRLLFLEIHALIDSSVINNAKEETKNKENDSQ